MIDGVKIIRHLPSKIDIADDPTLPFKVEVSMRPPKFMIVTFVMVFGGSEDVIARGSTRELIDSFLDKSGLRGHPRLRWIRLTSPDGSVKDIA